jgi:hypothetical protein
MTAFGPCWMLIKYPELVIRRKIHGARMNDWVIYYSGLTQIWHILASLWNGPVVAITDA